MIKKLGNNDNNQIQDFILLPEKDKLQIRASNFVVEFEEHNYSTTNNLLPRASRIMYTKTGIKSIKESQVMNLEHQNLGKREKRIIRKDSGF